MSAQPKNLVANQIGKIDNLQCWNRQSTMLLITKQLTDYYLTYYNLSDIDHSKQTLNFDNSKQTLNFDNSKQTLNFYNSKQTLNFYRTHPHKKFLSESSPEFSQYSRRTLVIKLRYYD